MPANQLENAPKPLISPCVINGPRSIYIGHRHSDVKSSLVDVTQPLALSIHQLKDGILVQNTIRRDRRRELREGSVAGRVIAKRLRTFMEVPASDQKLARLAFCQSYQTLSTIWGRRYLSEN
jgi:hypothetical protein